MLQLGFENVLNRNGKNRLRNETNEKKSIESPYL